MTLRLVISGVAMAGMAFSPSYAWLIVFILASGVGVATFSPGSPRHDFRLSASKATEHCNGDLRCLR